MDILKKSMALAVFGMIGEPEWDEFYDCLKARSAGSLDDVNVGKPSIGWAVGNDVLSCNFQEDNCRLGNYFIIHLRKAERKAASKLIEAAVERKLGAWMAVNGASHVPYKVRREVKIEVTDELNRKALPVIQWAQVIIAPDEQQVYVLASSAGLLEDVAIQFYAALGVELEAMSPLYLLKCANAEPLDGAVLNASAIGREFLTWCLWQSEIWKLDGEPSFYVSAPLELYFDDEKQDICAVATTVSAKGDAAPVCDELQAALAAGKTLSKALLRIAPDHDNLWEGQFDAGRMIWSGLKLPKDEPGLSQSEQICSRINAIQEMFQLVKNRFVDFVADYKSTTYGTRREEWIAGRKQK